MAGGPQPPEGGPGRSQEQLIELGRLVGLTDGFDACVANEVHLPWIESVTLRDAERGVTRTPSVFVAGVPVPANGPVIAAATAEITR